MSLNGALALLTAPCDCDLVEPVIASLDAADELAATLREKAEIARRRIILDGAAQNLEAIEKLNEKHRPSVKRDGPHPLDDIWPELADDLRALGIAYGEAVESDDYERAFVLAEYLLDWTVELRSTAEEWDRRL